MTSTLTLRRLKSQEEKARKSTIVVLSSLMRESSGSRRLRHRSWMEPLLQKESIEIDVFMRMKSTLRLSRKRR